jgi:hypothetical protein
VLDIWYTFPATMGEDQAWITYNHGYAEVAEADPRHNALRIKLPIKNPTEYGMPTNEEFPQLSSVDKALDDQISAVGGVYVGRVTVGGHRFFYFYVDITEKDASEIIESVSVRTSYELQYVYEPDKDSKYYWNELYPTDDDWQVIQDLKVLDALSDDGDIKEKQREVMHWAYFPNEFLCKSFTTWVKSENYVVSYSGKEEEGSEYLTKYSHNGTMNLGDITSHTIRSNRKARELGGRYDGWETSVERK